MDRDPSATHGHHAPKTGLRAKRSLSDLKDHLKPGEGPLPG